MIVKVKNLVGKVIELGVEPTDKVLHLKQLVQQKEGIPPSQQRLIFSAKSLFVQILFFFLFFYVILSLTMLLYEQ